jgi:outer membrane protein assembly factor BamB
MQAGYRWAPAAYSLIYSHAIYEPWVEEVEDNYDLNVPNCTAKAVHAFIDCGVAADYTTPLGVNGGVFGAINTLTGKVAWSIPMIASVPALCMTVAGDLVFFADATGLVYAASAATGEILWVYDALTVPGAAGAKSTGATVYEIGGVEYVAQEFGGTSFVQGNALLAFALPAAVAAAAEKSAAAKARVK